jgi:hypothetical protein
MYRNAFPIPRIHIVQPFPGRWVDETADARALKVDGAEGGHPSHAHAHLRSPPPRPAPGRARAAKRQTRRRSKRKLPVENARDDAHRWVRAQSIPRRP